MPDQTTILWLKVDPQPSGLRVGWYTDYLANRSFAGWMDDHGATAQHETPHRIGDIIDHNGKPHRVESVSVDKPCEVSQYDAIREGCQMPYMMSDVDYEQALAAGLKRFMFRDEQGRRNSVFGPKAEFLERFGPDATAWHWKITLTPEPQSCPTP